VRVVGRLKQDWWMNPEPKKDSEGNDDGAAEAESRAADDWR